jgi:hypothetical protein
MTLLAKDAGTWGLVSGAILLFTFNMALPVSCEGALPLGWRPMALKFFEIL